MDEATRRDLAALADGSLEQDARDAVLRRADESPELSDALARQRTAVAAIRATEGETASDVLRERVAEMAGTGGDRGAARVRAARPRRRLPRPRAFVLGSAIAAVAAAAVVLFAGGSQAPGVAEAAQVALSSPRAPAPAKRPGGRTLDASVDGVAYPYWEDTTGWKATGSRSDAVGGRTVRTVFYTHRGQRVGYAIAAGAPLSADGGTTIEKGGVRYRVLRTGGATVVTWLRDGHTCILAARGVDASVLVDLATWS